MDESSAGAAVGHGVMLGGLRGLSASTGWHEVLGTVLGSVWSAFPCSLPIVGGAVVSASGRLAMVVEV